MSRRRYMHGLGAVALALVVVGAVIASPSARAANTYLRTDSSCNGRSDPANVAVLNPRTRTLVGGDAAGTIARDDWHGGLGSSAAWYLFSSGACRPQDAWATNSILSGHHIRFFEPVDDADRAVAGAHHDFRCGLDHSANQFIESARAFDSWLSGWVDLAGQDAYAHVSFRLDRAYSTYLKCGQVVPDDGYTAVLQQIVPVAYPTRDPPSAPTVLRAGGPRPEPEPAKQHLRVGRTPTGRVWLRGAGDTDVTLIQGRTLTDRFDAGGKTITRFTKPADLWTEVQRRYGLTRAAITSGTRWVRPHAITPVRGGVVTIVRDAGTSLRVLSAVAKAPVATLGVSALGLPLARAALVTVREGPAVYRMATTIYAGDADEAGQLAVNDALQGSATERQYLKLFRARPHSVLGGRLIARINDRQIIVKLPHALVALTAPHYLSPVRWSSLVSRLAVTPATTKHMKH
jgi:hypothetical protein